MRLWRLKKGCSVAVLVLLGSGSPYATADSFSPPDNLQKCGEGELVVYRFVEIGIARLYRENCGRPFELNEPERRYMSFSYEYRVEAEDFVRGAVTYLEKNGIALTDALEEFHQAYRDIKPGQSYHLLLDEKQELHLYLDDERLASIEDPVLARSYFAIWLGSHPFDRKLKSRLLAS